MATREELLQQLDSITEQLSEIEQAEQAGSDLVTGMMVSFTGEEGESQIGEIERVDSETVEVRVMAVSGDSYEPTDKVLTVSKEEVSPDNGDDDPDPEEDPEDDGDNPDPQEEDEEDDEDEEEDDEDEEEEKLIKAGLFVKWASQAGSVQGRVIDVYTDEPAVIPETGDEYKASVDSPVALIEVYQDKDGWEDTGVHVAIPCPSLEVIDPLEVKQRKLIIKVKNYDLGDPEEEQESDSDDKVGWFEGIGSAYGKIDLGGDTVAKGAYTQTIQHNDGKIQLMFDHGWKVSDVAGVALLDDREEGLWVKGKMPLHIQGVRDGFEMIKFMQKEGKPLGLSIGYLPKKSEPGPNGTRILKEIALEEMTVTPWPMDTHARIRDAKDRKIMYHAKRRLWQSPIKTKGSDSADAPTGNRDQQGDMKSLIDLLRETKTQIEEQYV